jgi:hypothetical protein
VSNYFLVITVLVSTHGCGQGIVITIRMRIRMSMHDDVQHGEKEHHQKWKSTRWTRVGHGRMVVSNIM